MALASQTWGEPWCLYSKLLTLGKLLALSLSFLIFEMGVTHVQQFVIRQQTQLSQCPEHHKSSGTGGSITVAGFPLKQIQGIFVLKKAKVPLT